MRSKRNNSGPDSITKPSKQRTQAFAFLSQTTSNFQTSAQVYGSTWPPRLENYNHLKAHAGPSTSHSCHSPSGRDMPSWHRASLPRTPIRVSRYPSTGRKRPRCASKPTPGVGSTLRSNMTMCRVQRTHRTPITLGGDLQPRLHRGRRVIHTYWSLLTQQLCRQACRSPMQCASR